MQMCRLVFISSTLVGVFWAVPLKNNSRQGALSHTCALLQQQVLRIWTHLVSVRGTQMHNMVIFGRQARGEQKGRSPILGS